MAAQEQQEEISEPHKQQKLYGDDHFTKLLSSYLGLSFTIFLGFLPRNSIPLLSVLQNKNKSLSYKLMEAEEQLRRLHSRRKEDSRANARVVEIFASHRHEWQEEEKRLLQQIDECNEEISYLKGRVEDVERVEAELRASTDDLKREIGEKDEMLNFMSRGNCEVESSGGDWYSDMGLRFSKSGVSGGMEEEGYGGGGMEEFGAIYGHSNSGFGADYLNSASKLWSEKASLWQDMQYKSLGSLYHMKHFVSRRESPWKADGDSTGVCSKLKLLEQELLNLEKNDKGDLFKVPSQLRKQAKRYQSLAEKINDLCNRMQASDPCESTLSPEFRTQRQTEFLLEGLRLQQRASETGEKLMVLHAETGKTVDLGKLEGPTKLATQRSLDSIRNNLKEIQRNVEIWLARIIGDLEGILARDSTSRERIHYVSRYPFAQ